MSTSKDLGIVYLGKTLVKLFADVERVVHVKVHVEQLVEVREMILVVPQNEVFLL